MDNGTTCPKLYLDENSYSRTSEERTLWEQRFCPWFGGFPISEVHFFSCLIFSKSFYYAYTIYW